MAHDESFERALAPEPTKRKRSSILKLQPEKRSRDSRTVSFNDKYYYKELYQDGTCDITNFFLGEDMDLTMMDVIDPVDCSNQTIDASVEMSMEQTIVGTQCIDLTLMTQTNNNNNTNTSNNNSNNTQSMVAANVSQLDETLDERDMISVNPVNPVNNTEVVSQTLQTSQISQFSQLSQMSNISSLDETLFGAFHDSNNISMLSSRTSGVDTLLHNMEALNDCIQRVDHETQECRNKLDAEMQNLFKFYRHIVNNNDPYEFAIAIFGLRYSLWLIIKIDPDLYPNEKLRLRFAVRKRDKHLYPFRDYAEAVRKYTREGTHGYLTRFVINAQKFRRFLKKIGYRQPNPELNQHSKCD